MTDPFIDDMKIVFEQVLRSTTDALIRRTARKTLAYGLLAVCFALFLYHGKFVQRARPQPSEESARTKPVQHIQTPSDAYFAGRGMMECRLYPEAKEKFDFDLIYEPDSVGTVTRLAECIYQIAVCGANHRDDADLKNAGDALRVLGILRRLDAGRNRDAHDLIQKEIRQMESVPAMLPSAPSN